MRRLRSVAPHDLLGQFEYRAIPIDALEAKLSDLKQRGGSARLSDLTDFSWDEVHLFNEYTRREAIEKIVGTR